LAHKDMTLATQLGRDFNVPMRIDNLALAELSEALSRGWGDRDSRSPMILQQERAASTRSASRTRSDTVRNETGRSQARLRKHPTAPPLDCRTISCYIALICCRWLAL
jgi:hypothetical protein